MNSSTLFCKVRTFLKKGPDFFIPCPALFEKSRHQLLVPWQEQENEKIIVSLPA